MAATKSKMGSNISDQNISELRQQVSNLRSELEAEKKLNKQLRREKIHEVKEAICREQRKHAVALLDLRTKLRQDKLKEIENHKSLLSKKHDAEVKKLTKVKDSEINKLKSEYQKLQTESSKKQKKCGLSDSARGAFDNEHAKLLHDIDELRGVRQQLEAQLTTLTEADRQKADDLRKQQEIHKVEITKIKRENDYEIRKLLDELKSKQRTISQLERDLSTKTVHLSQLRADKEKIEDKLNLTREAESWEKRSQRRSPPPVVVVVEPVVAPTVDVEVQTMDDVKQKKVEKLEHDIELTTQKAVIKRLEDQVSSLRQDKMDMIQRVQEAEMRHKAVLEKNRKFLDKNIDLTKENRAMSDKVQQLTQENFQLKAATEAEKLENQRLRDHGGFDRLQRETFLLMQKELMQLRRETSEHDRTIKDLQYAVQEKDRRIELMTIKRRKQKRGKVLQKKTVRFLLPAKAHFVAGFAEETVCGIEDDEDSGFVYSADLAPTCSSYDDEVEEDSAFNEYTHGELEKGYQQLVKEHMELEKSYSLMCGDPSTADSPEWHAKALEWQEEKEKLERKVRRLQLKVEDYAGRFERLEAELSDAHEQNEILEFRMLELEDRNEKMVEQLPRDKWDDSPMKLDNEMPLEERLAEVRKKIIAMKNMQESPLSEGEKEILSQAGAILEISGQHLCELEAQESSLFERVQALQEEKEELQDTIQALSADAQQEYETSKVQLTIAEEKIDYLNKLVVELKEENQALHDQQENESYTESERDDTALLVEQLKNKVRQHEKSESELMEKNVNLEKTVQSLKNRLAGFSESWDEAEPNDQASESRNKPHSKVDLSSDDPGYLKSQLQELNCRWQKGQEQIQECHTELLLRKQDIEQWKRQVEEREHMIEAIEERVTQLEKERDRANERTGQLEEIRRRLEERVKELGQVEEELHELAHLRYQVEELDKSKLRLRERISELEVLTEEETSRALNLEEQIQTLEENNKDLEKQVKAGKEAAAELQTEITEAVQAKEEELGLHIKSLEKSENELKVKVKELTWKVKEAHEQELAAQDRLALVTEEKARRIALLEQQVDCLEANEAEFIKTINSLEDIEEELKRKLVDMESKDQSAAMKQEAAKLRDELKRLKDKVKELTNRESELLEENYQMKMENQDLQDHIDELISHSEDADSTEGTNPDAIYELKVQVDNLTSENAGLKDELLKAKLSSIGSVQDTTGLSDDAKAMTELTKKIVELESNLNQVKADRDSTERHLKDNISSLEKSESDLKGQLMVVRAENDRLQQEIEVLRSKEERNDQLESSLQDYEIREEQLRDQLSELDHSKATLTSKLETYRKGENEEISQLRQKVDILLDTEEKLIDRLTEKEQIEAELREEIAQYEQMNADLATQEGEADGAGSAQDAERIQQLELTEKELKNELNEWERLCTEYKAKVDGLEGELAQAGITTATLMEKVSMLEANQKMLNEKISEYERAESQLKLQLAQLQGENIRLMEAGNEFGADDSGVDNTMRPYPSSDVSGTRTTKELIDATFKDLIPSTPKPVTIRLSSYSELERLDQPQLISRLQELEGHEGISQQRIYELETSLSNLQQAVAVLTNTLEVDTDVPIMHFRPGTKDSEFEAHVQGLVKAEVTNRLRVLETHKENIMLKTEVEENKRRLEAAHEQHQADMEQMEAQLDRLRKSEISLKAKVDYQDWGKDSLAEGKIHHLEETLRDMEESEGRLKARIAQLQESEKELREELEYLKSNENSNIPYSLMKNVRNKEEYYQLVEQLTLLEASERDLKDKLFTLEQSDTFDLLSRIATLERSERGLKRKVEIMEMSNDSGFNESFADMVMMDTPEAILKQRLCDLEKVERNLKQQVADLEHDREELHDLARKDKNKIHELTVQLREQQQGSKSLKEALNRSQAAQHALVVRADDMNAVVEELEEKLRRTLQGERQLKASLLTAKNEASDARYMMDSVREEGKAGTEKLQRKVDQLIEENQQLKERLETLTHQLEDKQGAETSLKDRLQVKEDTSQSQESMIMKLELAEKAANDHAIELEKCNDHLAEKARELEEKAASLNFEVSELQMNKEESAKEIKALKAKLKEVQGELSDSSGTHTKLQTKARELAMKEIEVLGKVRELEGRERDLMSTISDLESNEQNLKVKVQELEASISSVQSELAAKGDVECENSQLQNTISCQNRSLEQLEHEVHELKDKLNLYEYSNANKDLATVPRTELTELRAQVRLLGETEQNLTRLEKSEAHLKDVVSKLREGKEACGHELEIQELKSELDKYSQSVKAHELLKKNHQEVKQQLADLHEKFQSGSVTIRSKSHSNKAVQVHLADAIAIKDLAPGNAEEFKEAVKILGAKHPAAYQEFVQSLAESTQGQRGGNMRFQTQEVQEGTIVPTSTQGIQQGAGVARAYSHGDKQQLVQQFVAQLPMQDAMVQADTPISNGSSLDDAPVPGGERQANPARPIDVATETERGDLIEGLTKVLPSGDIHCCLNEEQHWERIEAMSATSGGTNDDIYWQNMEKPGKKIDDMTMVFVFGSETDANTSESSRASSRHKRRPHSAGSSVGSSIPPPLPTSQPPPRAVYNLVNRHDDGITSADEASEICDEEVIPKHQLRARSVDRDSNFSEDMSSASIPRGHSNLGKFTASLDSIPDSGLVTMRTSELEGSVAPPSQFQEKMVPIEEYKLVKAKLARLEEQIKEKERSLEHVKQAKHSQGKLTEELLMSGDAAVLSKQLEDKDKALQSEKHQTKDLKNQLTRFRSEISQKDAEINRLTTEISHLESSMHAKTNEVDRLSTELRKWQHDCREAKDNKSHAEESLAAIQAEMEVHRKTSSEYKELQQTNTDLKQQYDELVQKYKNLETAEQDKASLEKIVLKLRGQLKDAERMQLECEDLQTRLQAAEQAVKNKSKMESELSKENISMRHDLENFKQEVIQCRNIEKDYLRVRAKFDEMEAIKTKAQTAITPLRAKVVRLTKHCKQKDELIGQLAKELRRVGESHDLVAQADRVTSLGASEEYTRPISPLLQSITPKEPQLNSEDLAELSQEKYPSKIPRWHTLLSQSSLSGTDLDLPLEHQLRGRRSTKDFVQIDDHYRKRSKSATDIDANGNQSSLVRPVQLAMLPKAPVTLLNNQRSRSSEGQPHRRSMKAAVEGGVYTAVKDYDPSVFSQSGHTQLELPLVEGQTVRVLGPVDEKGYCEAEVDGQVGLVPVSYLKSTQVVPIKPVARRHRHKLGKLQTDSSPEQILGLHQHLQSLAAPAQHVPYPPVSWSLTYPGNLSNPLMQHPAFIQNNALSVPVPSAGYHMHNTAPGAPVCRPASVPNVRQSTPVTTSSPRSAGELFEGRPDAPSCFHVERILGRHSVLLGWEPPLMDELARSNGVAVKGYKLYINNKEKQLVSSPHLTKALVEKLDLHRTHHFSVQTVAEGGALSHMVHAMLEQPAPPRGDSGSESAADGDVSSVLSSIHPEDGERRVFMAIYDYNPAEHSPHDFPASELAFHAGDIVVTYGSVRPDGFFHGKVHGKKGLVPASFIEEVALLRPKQKKKTGTVTSSASLQQPCTSRSSSLISGESSRPSNTQQQSHSHQNSTKVSAAKV